MTLRADIAEGKTLYGFTLLKKTSVNLPKLKLYEFIHDTTGARYLHMEADDENNCFAVAFRTVPQDSTGIAHILEHVVLCGSERYKTRDPFFSMLKRSMSTFMNAFTGEDWTMYPFATCNRTDFYNLLGVYLDAAFFPLIKEESFMQEGHHLMFKEAGNPKSGLTVGGVVFNEMKGAMSSQSDMMHRKLTEALYPSITYHYNSGGDPLAIPTLKYQDLKNFHAVHYHPSNAWFFTYGNMPAESHMQTIEDTVLSKFTQRDVNTRIPAEQRYTAPRYFEYPYAFSADDNAEDAYQTATAWLTNPITQTDETVSMSLLEQMILGNSASPLRKSLLESGLGKSLSDVTGYAGEMSETFFAAGLQGVKKKDISAVSGLVLNTLHDIRRNGIDKRQIESVIHNYEFDNREYTSGSYPAGLRYILKTYPMWSNGADPADVLDFERLMVGLHNRLEKDPHYFEGLIEKHLLKNPHRVDITLYPDAEFDTRQERDIASYVSGLEVKMTDADLQTVDRRLEQLEQSREDIGDMDSLPFLPVSKINPDKQFADPTNIEQTPNIYSYTADNNGVVYFRLFFRMPELTAEERLLVPVFTYLFNKSGTETYTYDELSLALNVYTGGINSGADVSLEISPEAGSQGIFYDYAEFGGKALARNTGKLFELAEEVLLNFSFRDLKRVRTLLGQRYVGMVNSVNAAGSNFAAASATRKLNPALEISEMYQGITQIKASAKYQKYNDEELTAFLQRLEVLGRRIFSSADITAFVCTDKEYQASVGQATKAFIAKLPSAVKSPQHKIQTGFAPELLNESWFFRTPVSYVVKSIPTVNMCHPDAAALFAAAGFIQAEYIHPEIREKGGAYGGYARYDAFGGVFSFMSYRDPNYRHSLEIYEGAVAWLAKEGMTQTQLEETILTSFRKLDVPPSPAEKCLQDFMRHYLNRSREMVLDFRNRLIKLTAADITRVVNTYLTRPGSFAALTSEEIYNRDFAADKSAPVKYKLFSE